MDRTVSVPEITVTTHDSDRLLEVVDTMLDAPRLTDVGRFLDEELARAAVVAPEAVGPRVATMNSRVEYEDLTTGQRRAVSLVYPRDADSDAGRLSIASPVGVALLGLAEGQELTWKLSDGRRRRTRLVKVIFQPEAAGRHDL